MTVCGGGVHLSGAVGRSEPLPSTNPDWQQLVTSIAMARERSCWGADRAQIHWRLVGDRRRGERAGGDTAAQPTGHPPSRKPADIMMPLQSGAEFFLDRLTHKFGWLSEGGGGGGGAHRRRSEITAGIRAHDGPVGWEQANTSHLTRGALPIPPILAPDLASC